MSNFNKGSRNCFPEGKTMQLTEVQLTQTQAVVHAIQEQLAALSAPPIPSGKDNPTEGEKKTQEKDQEAAAEGKGKELITERESRFSRLLEEGEIDEPYVPEYVEWVLT